MVYKLKRRKYNVLSLLIICSGLVVPISYASYAEDDGRPVPLKVYIPKVTSLPKYFAADKLEYNIDDSILTAKGKVEIEQGDMIVRADSIEYDQVRNSVKANGNVVILDPSGQVSFADATELKSEMKDSIIRNFRVRLADNEVFMAGEARKSEAPVTNDKSFFGRVFAYLAPERSASDTAKNLSAFEPAAGEAVVVEDKPVIGNVPLIVLPETTSKIEGEEAKQENPVIEKKISNTEPPAILNEQQSTTSVTIPSANPVNSLIDTQIKKDLKPTTSPEEVKTVSPEEVKVVEPKLEEVKTEEPKIKASKAEVLDKKKSAKNPAKDLDKQKSKSEIKSVTESSGEPIESLSPKSRELLEKVSTSAAPKKADASPKPLEIDHTRDMQDLFKANESSNMGTARESLGVKVENKNQRINLDHELERAYDAIGSGNSEVAIETYKNILNNAPDNVQALFGLATLYHRARQFDKARPLYGRLLAIDPNHRDGFNNFLVLLADEAPREALVELEKLESKNLGFSTIPAQMAVIYQKLGDQDKATGKMFRAVALAPENLTYRYNLAIMLDKQKNYEEAAKLYRQLLEAEQRGEKIPGNIESIQQRLTFIGSNR